MNVVSPFEGIGASVRRKEDLRFLSGRGQYTDDISRPGQAHAFILRSPHAHARILRLDASEARAMPGVVAVYTGEDTAKLGSIPCGWQIHNKDGSPLAEPRHPGLAQGPGPGAGGAAPGDPPASRRATPAAGQTHPRAAPPTAAPRHPVLAEGKARHV